MARPCELSDEAWDVVSDPSIETQGQGRPRLNDRLMLDGVLWILCSGAAWRDMPERFGSANNLDASHIRLEHLRHYDRAICLLIIFQDRH
ncbi:hypothetical protein PssiTeo3_52120 [Pseudomonas sichuanensis]|nr:hypothetical protein [Pseudomonas sichuanensis]